VKHKVRHIHFVGIGGSGMSGIAEVLANLGYQVSGSDLAENAATRRLAALGVKVKIRHSSQYVNGADAVVVSSAVQADNPEVLAARDKRIPVVPRALMLAELMRLKQGVAIAGTHGKTTTTSLVASVLAEAGLDPTFVIGGRLNAAGSNARLGAGDFIVVEADESDASFLHLQPVIAVVTNIDADHMDTYAQDFGRLKNAFVQFLQNLPFYGAAVLCADDPHVRDILAMVTKPVITYGTNDAVSVRAEGIAHDRGRMRFRVLRRDAKPLDVVLNLPGRHNVLNALAAIAVGTELGLRDEFIQKALAEFHGVGRRFQSYGEVEGGFTLIDLFEDFVRVLSSVDVLLLGEVYAAGEAPIVAADGRSLARALRLAGKVEPIFVEDIAEMSGAIRRVVEAGDVVITMGAGSIGGVPAQLAQPQ
jgi:UDP-N-acetylmuramate--alanine ligase